MLLPEYIQECDLVYAEHWHFSGLAELQLPCCCFQYWRTAQIIWLSSCEEWWHSICDWSSLWPFWLSAIEWLARSSITWWPLAQCRGSLDLEQVRPFTVASSTPHIHSSRNLLPLNAGSTPATVALRPPLIGLLIAEMVCQSHVYSSRHPEQPGPNPRIWRSHILSFYLFDHDIPETGNELELNIQTIYKEISW